MTDKAHRLTDEKLEEMEMDFQSALDEMGGLTYAENGTDSRRGRCEIGNQKFIANNIRYHESGSEKTDRKGRIGKCFVRPLRG